MVVIASSTGGPAALARLVPKLPAPLGAGGVIVQHMPPGFTASLATRLDKASPLSVSEAVAGDTLSPDRMLLAPGGLHLRIDAQRRAVLSEDEPVGGMGNDGLLGAKAVRAQGGRVLIQEESTCAVYGMPRAVAEAGLADAVHSLDDLPAAIAREAG
jgi:two-component system chemotaxis response regulator CheB